jgi:hypothetical protein
MQLGYGFVASKSRTVQKDLLKKHLLILRARCQMKITHVNNATFFNNCVTLRLKYGLTFRFTDYCLLQTLN